MIIWLYTIMIRANFQYVATFTSDQNVMLRFWGSSRARSPLPWPNGNLASVRDVPDPFDLSAENQDGDISARGLTMAFLRRAEAAAIQRLVKTGAAPARLRHPIGCGTSISTHGPILTPEDLQQECYSAVKRADTLAGAYA